MDLGHPDLQLLFDGLMNMTKKLLEPQGGFLPNGAIVLPNGKLAYVGAAAEKAQPGAQVLLRLLEGGLRGIVVKEMARAAGISVDTRLKSPPRPEDVGKDAIWIFLEHKDGACINVYTPYTQSAPGQFTYREPFTALAQPRIFINPAH